MARGTKQIDGQLVLDMCLNTSNYVCQANSLIGGKQALSINSAKIIRSAIMQVVREDSELRTYKVTISELAELLNVSRNNLYRDIGKISDEILKSHVEIRLEQEGDAVRWKKINWVSFIEYQSDVGLAIKLNNDLKPYLLNLKQRYTQYTLDNILAMKSIYAIRIYELLQEQIRSMSMPFCGMDIELSVEYIRQSCGCEKKYERFSQFKEKVIDAAMM